MSKQFRYSLKNYEFIRLRSCGAIDWTNEKYVGQLSKNNIYNDQFLSTQSLRQKCDVMIYFTI